MYQRLSPNQEAACSHQVNSTSSCAWCDFSNHQGCGRPDVFTTLEDLIEVDEFSVKKYEYKKTVTNFSSDVKVYNVLVSSYEFYN
ncbi:hypothetical protein ISN44_As13g014690 [Arabidopsis suecica]|uniref:Uncharacterized protein n=1 Tax=Arabidopsis suecica TaxID=45249 RepID=A0A8T1XRT8_ARASU|nr:hypothetical protein ISN44_As13g014690 [Arabidopsis suecica]KAG7537597.1 hypothetical protein ISN44_As13g014690 [Arabidopsis suecica]